MLRGPPLLAIARHMAPGTSLELLWDMFFVAFFESLLIDPPLPQPRWIVWGAALSTVATCAVAWEVSFRPEITLFLQRRLRPYDNKGDLPSACMKCKQAAASISQVHSLESWRSGAGMTRGFLRSYMGTLMTQSARRVAKAESGSTFSTSILRQSSHELGLRFGVGRGAVLKGAPAVAEVGHSLRHLCADLTRSLWRKSCMGRMSVAD